MLAKRNESEVLRGCLCSNDRVRFAEILIGDSKKNDLKKIDYYKKGKVSIGSIFNDTAHDEKGCEFYCFHIKIWDNWITGVGLVEFWLGSDGDYITTTSYSDHREKLEHVETKYLDMVLLLTYCEHMARLNSFYEQERNELLKIADSNKNYIKNKVPEVAEKRIGPNMFCDVKSKLPV